MTELASARGALPAVSPFDLYAEGLDGSAVYVRDAAGRRSLLPTPRWVAGLQPGDESLLARCVGPTLDVGCGPGRMVRALVERRTPALGIDVSADAVALARSTGVAVLQRDVFDEVPAAGRWSRLLLVDGNIGIGGDPVRLLDRCRALLAPGGLILAELARTAPDAAGPERLFRLENGAGRVSTWFPWAVVDLVGICRIATPAGLRIVTTWPAAGRLFVALAPSPEDDGPS